MAEKKLELLDFYADWCGPCRVMQPILEDIAQQRADTVMLTKINVDEHADQAQQYGVRSIPTLVFKKDGQVVDQVVGAVSKADLEGKVAELLE